MSELIASLTPRNLGPELGLVGTCVIIIRWSCDWEFKVIEDNLLCVHLRVQLLEGAGPALAHNLVALYRQRLAAESN